MATESQPSCTASLASLLLGCVVCNLPACSIPLNLDQELPKCGVRHCEKPPLKLLLSHQPPEKPDQSGVLQNHCLWALCFGSCRTPSAMIARSAESARTSGSETSLHSRDSISEGRSASSRWTSSPVASVSWPSPYHLYGDQPAHPAAHRHRVSRHVAYLPSPPTAAMVQCSRSRKRAAKMTAAKRVSNSALDGFCVSLYSIKASSKSSSSTACGKWARSNCEKAQLQRGIAEL